MKKIKPYTIVFYIAGVLTLLLTLTILIPEGRWDLGWTKVKFLSKDAFLHPKEQEKADITELIAVVDTTMVVEDLDSLIQHQNNSKGNVGAPNGGDIREEASTDLLMEESGKTNLHAFFKKLNGTALKHDKISILHYGDSQIEGDRMTNYLRQKIQTQFGGYGPGLIPATDVYNTYTFKQTFSENFERFTAFGRKKLEDRKYGAMASASRFTPVYILDSLFTIDSLVEQIGWIEIGPSPSAYSRAKTYNNIKMHYNSCIAMTILKVFEEGELIHEEELIQDGAQHTVKLSFQDTPGKLKFEFTGKISPNVCAFSLEGDYGVQVSNIGMRGSSGTVFRVINNSTLRSMFEETNAQLVIMQFGGNSVPFFKDSTGVTGYANWLRSQMNTVRRAMPGSMVIVIGPSDMSELTEGIRETYTFLPYCVEEIKRVTLESGGAFWNMYAGMGGKNSMPSWVEQGLAANDYIHFSNGGAKFASQMFYDAFIAEFAKWRNQNN